MKARKKDEHHFQFAVGALCDALRDVAAHDVVAATMLHHLEAWDTSHCAGIIVAAVTAFAERDKAMTKLTTDTVARYGMPAIVRVSK